MENLKLIANPQDPPLGALIVAELINSSKKGKIDVQLLKDWKNPTNIQLSDDKNIFADWETSVSRILSQHLAPELSGGADCVAKTQVDTWINFANGPLSNQQSHEKSLDYLNSTLSTKTYLVDKKLSLGDIYVFSKIHTIKIDEKYNHVARWYKQMLAIPAVQKYSSISSQQKSKKPEGKKQEKTATKQDSTGRKQEGLFIDLPGAKMGEVVVRFPPEASGYLHIGHAKAALLNQHYAQIYKGKLIMRFDDTNPAKENVEFEQAILEDLKLLDIKPDRFTHSSDYFDMMLESCEKLIKLGKAYADDTPAEIMRDQREKKEPSANRDNSVEKNLEMWQEMKIASEKGQQCCIRAKMFYDSLNGAMRDPTIYRCKPEPHPRTGTKYKVYPTYDFACPIVDSVEGVTLTLRTTEYLDRDDQFYWFIEALNLRRPEIWAYSRLNMTNTVLSKRKLTWFVNEGLVDGWDDPRFPTVRGIIRRGMTVEGLKQFIIAQGSSRSVVFMSWDKIWSFNRKVLDPITTRYTALNSHELVPVDVAGATAGFLTAQNHPKDPTKGTKQVKIGPKLLIERADAETLVEGQNATFINWGNILIEKINRTNGVITGVQGKLNLDDRDFKNTVKLTWLAAEEKETGDLVKCFAVYFDHIISKAILGKDEDFKDFIGKETRKEVEVTGEMELKRVKKGEIIQLQRKGFFRCDVPFVPASGFSGKDQPMVLFHIPDGHVTTPNTTATKETSKKSAKKESSISVSSGSDISSKIAAQGEKVRQLKADKADKAKVTEEVQILLKLKAEFKEATGQDWKPGQASVAPPVSADDISSKIAAQGEKVRQLKADKADKAKVTEEVQVLLKLKTEYKEVTGQDWKPGQAPAAPKVSADDISSKIAAQGEKVRQLKADKADKVKIGEEVQVLLKLKTEFKEVTGQEWKPSAVVATPKPSTDDISSKIAAQGEKVRQLKADKADKAKVTEEVQLLLKLKAEFKEVTGQDWKPGKAPVAPTVSADDISSKIAAQGEKVRQLEAKVTEEVQVLLKLKTEYKEATGQDWKPAAQAPKESSAKVVEKKDKQMSSSGQSSSLPGDEISAKITDQGDKVRQLKAAKADKATVTEAVDILLKLKKEYKEKTGQEWKPPGAVDTKSKAPEKPTKKDKPTKQIEKKDDTTKTGTRLGLEAKKNDDLSTWYSQVITKGEMIEYYDVSGCYVLRPWSYSIWKKIRHFLDGEIEKLGVEDCYFPIFVSKSALEREKDHIADFAPEVAWVTKSGDSDLAEPIAIRPTSETVMYPAYAKWLKSHRDLPLKLNQWNNVVRWEFKDPQPFLRTREFLWQEGHSAFATKAEAEEEVLQILELYARVYEELLAIPVVRGKKSEKEKFAGGDYTTTVEAFVSASGRAIQGATSHHLGQNFSEMFDMQVEGVEEGSDKSYVYQNSWGLTTRTIGVMVMVHGDDKGLVLPPRVASVQAIIVPCGITASTTPEQRQKLMDECLKLEQELKKDNKLKVRGDYRDNYSPGWKFNHWELKGVPVRVELGFKDLEKNQVTFVRRDNGEKLTASRNNVLGSIHELLEKIQAAMFAKASAELGEHIKQTNDWTDFCQQLDKKNILLSPFCGEISCEDKIKADSTREKTEDGAPSMGAKSLCIPFEQPKVSIDKIKCVHPDCKNKAKFYTLFGRSY